MSERHIWFVVLAFAAFELLTIAAMYYDGERFAWMAWVCVGVVALAEVAIFFRLIIAFIRTPSG